jgi:hypothetical protein
MDNVNKYIPYYQSKVRWVQKEQQDQKELEHLYQRN